MVGKAPKSGPVTTNETFHDTIVTVPPRETIFSPPDPNRKTKKIKRTEEASDAATDPNHETENWKNRRMEIPLRETKKNRERSKR
ncbi:hypothetical protein NL676_035721 [Syzygium grande]|nr:hypothetical protein NL676_035721 [Syzygium grande]